MRLCLAALQPCLAESHAVNYRSTMYTAPAMISAVSQCCAFWTGASGVISGEIRRGVPRNDGAYGLLPESGVMGLDKGDPPHKLSESSKDDPMFAARS